MKKFIKPILTIVIFLGTLFLINFTRNFFFIKNMLNKQEEFFSNLSNYKLIIEQGTVGLSNETYLIYSKDNIYLIKETSNFLQDKIVWIDSKNKAYFSSDEQDSNTSFEIEMEKIEKFFLKCANFFEDVKFSELLSANMFNIIKSYDTTTWSGEECYILELHSMPWEFYIGKDTSLIKAIRFSEGAGIGGFILTIEKDCVTDEDITKPQ